jgi:hypothetical protein
MRAGASRCSRSVPSTRRERELVHAHRALQRMPAEPLDEVGAPRHDARLRAAEELVAGEADEIGACGERLARRRLAWDVAERARTEVVDERQAVAARDRRELLDPRQLGEADDAEVRLVHAEEDRRLGPDRRLVVGCARAVRRPHLDQACAGAREHVGDAEAVADLEQLAARDDDLASLRERGEREQYRRRVVVHDERRLRAREPADETVEMILPRSALAAHEIELEIRVAARSFEHACERLGRERGAAEVRVDDDAGGVEDAPEAGRARRPELARQPQREVPGIDARLYLFTRAREDRPGGVDGERVVDVPCELVHRGQVAQLHDGKRYCASALWGSCGLSASVARSA